MTLEISDFNSLMTTLILKSSRVSFLVLKDKVFLGIDILPQVLVFELQARTREHVEEFLFIVYCIYRNDMAY